VLFRLLCPVSFSSRFSLIGLVQPHASTAIDDAFSSVSFIPADTVHAQSPRVELPVPGIGGVINASLPDGPKQLAADTLEFPMAAATVLWLIGIGVMLLYSAVSMIRLRGRLTGAVRIRDNIYLADHIATPFVIGVWRPKIYMPSTLTKEEQGYVLLHEQTHIRRLDHLAKMLAFLALSVHWFNRLVWAAFVLAVKAWRCPATNA
jgi:beta-lactamase regulating signal transducer with metallopeptidase domain